jgi:hypothetical protein
MIALSPLKLILTAPVDRNPGGAQWFRLARTRDGILCLESISDVSLNRTEPSPTWAFGGDVPPHIARQLTNEGDHDQVASVLDRALRALKYT